MIKPSLVVSTDDNGNKYRFVELDTLLAKLLRLRKAHVLWDEYYPFQRGSQGFWTDAILNYFIRADCLSIPYRGYRRLDILTATFFDDSNSPMSSIVIYYGISLPTQSKKHIEVKDYIIGSLF